MKKESGKGKEITSTTGKQKKHYIELTPSTFDNKNYKSLVISSFVAEPKRMTPKI